MYSVYVYECIYIYIFFTWISWYIYIYIWYICLSMCICIYICIRIWCMMYIYQDSRYMYNLIMYIMWVYVYIHIHILLIHAGLKYKYILYDVQPVYIYVNWFCTYSLYISILVSKRLIYYILIFIYMQCLYNLLYACTIIYTVCHWFWIPAYDNSHYKY